MLVKNRAGIIWNLSDKEAFERIAKDGWQKVEVKPIEVQEEKTEIEVAREKYSAKYGKQVANSKKNDLEWINSKL